MLISKAKSGRQSWAFLFSNSTIENLKNQINIIDVVGRVVPLKRAGSNYKGVCPFHNEKDTFFCCF